MKKRVFAFVIAMMSACCMFASCGDSKDDEKETSSKTSQSEEKKEDKQEEPKDEAPAESKDETPAETPEEPAGEEPTEELSHELKVEPSNMLSKAINTVLVDLDAEGINVTGTYVISSDPSKNTGVDFGDGNIEKFYSGLANYYIGLEGLNYVAYIEDGACKACYAVSKQRTDGCDYPDEEDLTFDEAIAKFSGKIG